jgi:predicted phage tail protein
MDNGKPTNLSWPRGALGGGQSVEVRTPEEEDDTLSSRQYARFLDLISEGLCVGLCDKNWNPITSPASYGKGVFFNETQLIGDDNSPAFKDVRVGQKYGQSHNAQSPISGFVGAEDTRAVGVEVRRNYPVIRRISESETNRVKIGIRIPRMFKQEDDGDIVGSHVTMALHISHNGGPWGWYRRVSIVGKASSDFVAEYELSLPHTADWLNDFWDIRLSRSTDDTESKEQRASFWDYYTRVMDQRYRYPYSFYIATHIDAKSVNEIPQRAFRCKGKYVYVPSNYLPAPIRRYYRDPTTGANTGHEVAWNGTFYAAWTDNPAWIFYDMLTNPSYGMGRYISASLVDKWSLYSIGRYCDGGVLTPIGRYEPRFTCNCYIQTKEEAWKVLSDLASVFRGMLYWAGGTVHAVSDRPTNALMLFGPANVEGGIFNYQGTGRNARVTAVTVRWNDPKEFFKPKFEYVDDPIAIQRYGFRERELTAFGCTSEFQAQRLAKWMLITDQLETETVTFVTGLDGAYLRPGDVIGIQDPDRTGLKFSGRVEKFLTNPGNPYGNTIILDSVPATGSLVNYTISIYYPRNFYGDDTSGVKNDADMANIRPVQFWTTTITAWNPATRTIRTKASFEMGRIAGSYLWIISTAVTAAHQYFRVVSIKETEKFKYQVTAATYNSSKYAAVEAKGSIYRPKPGVIPAYNVVKTPLNFKVALKTVVRPEGAVYVLQLSWTHIQDKTLAYYVLHYLAPGTSQWMGLSHTNSNTYDFNYNRIGTYQFKLYSANVLGTWSPPAIASYTVKNLPTITTYRITGLEVDYGGNSTTFDTRDPRFDWRLNSPAQAMGLASTAPYGASSGTYDPMFKDYQVDVYDATVEPPRLGIREYITNTYFTVLKDQNRKAFGAAKAKLLFRVTPRHIYNTEGQSMQILVTNYPPALPKDFVGTPAKESITLSWSENPGQDVDLYEISFNTLPTTTGRTALGVSPTNSFLHAALEHNTTYYYWLRAVDTFGQRSSYTAMLSVTTLP